MPLDEITSLAALRLSLSLLVLSCLFVGHAQYVKAADFCLLCFLKNAYRICEGRWFPSFFEVRILHM